MNGKLNSSQTLFDLALLCLLFTALIAGCGKKSESTLPPVDDEAKARAATQESAAPTPSEIESSSLTAAEISSGWVIKDLINARSKPGTTADVVSQLPRGTEVKLIELADKWWKVQLADGRTAHVFETLLTKERYVDPWTRFKFDASRVDPALNIISGIVGIDGEVPSAALTVSADEWNSLTVEDRSRTAESAFSYWSECLVKCGYDPKLAVLVFRDTTEKELGRITAAAGKALFKPKP